MAEATETPTTNKGRAKRFLLAYFGVYVAVSIGLNVTLGPPGMSGSFLENHRAEYDRYLETTKLDSYKRWSQRPELNPPDEDLRARITFVETFTQDAEFKAEQKRRLIYDLLFDFFNVGMVILLVVRFAKTPLGAFLHSMVDTIRGVLDEARTDRERASRRRAEAQDLIEELPEVLNTFQERIQKRIEEMRGDFAATNELSLEVLARETEDRKRHEEVLAQQALKQELIDEAIAVAAKRFMAHTSPVMDAALVDQFVDELERTS